MRAVLLAPLRPIVVDVPFRAFFEDGRGSDLLNRPRLLPRVSLRLHYVDAGPNPLASLVALDLRVLERDVLQRAEAVASVPCR